MQALFSSSLPPAYGNKRYIMPGLDGLRAIAVLMVMTYHFWPQILPGGMIGVDIFFVISGFLITALLLREGAYTGRIALGSFWLRRARRLLPAIVLLIIIMGPIALSIGGDIQVNLGRQILGAFTFSSNWLSIAAGNDYFAQTTPELYTNFWSLAVEEQFYVFWPLILLSVGVLLRKRWRAFRWVILALLTASLLWAGYLSLSGAPVSRIYYGTDAHIYGLLLGAWLAFIRPFSLYPPSDPEILARVAQPFGLAAFARVLLGWASFFALIPLALYLSDANPATIPWGLAAASVLTCGIIQAILPDMRAGASTLLRALLSIAPLRWVGERSYGLYLWHWPLAVVLHYTWGADKPEWANLLVLAATFIIAAISYRWVETPIRRYGFKGAASRALDAFGAARYKSVHMILACALVLASFATATAVVTAPSMTAAQAVVEQGKQRSAERAAARASSRAATASASTSTAPSASASASAGAKPSASASTSASASPKASEAPVAAGAVSRADSAKVTIIGDSVVEASTADIYDMLPEAALDAKEARTIVHALPLIKSMASQGQLRKVVVLSVTANSTYSTSQLEQVLAALPADSKLVLVTGHGPARLTWIAQSNALIKDFAAKNSSRVVIADWDAAITEALKSDPSLLVSDGVHPEGAGQELYAKVMTEGVARALK